MIAGDLISDYIYPVKPTDKLSAVLEQMHEQHVGQLPVVSKKQLLGLIVEEDIANAGSESVKLLTQKYDLVFAYQNQFIYDVIRLFYAHQLDVLPVITEDNLYLGAITLRELADNMTLLTGSTEQGGVIVLEVNERDNALSHIAQIVESDNAQIMSSYVRIFPDSTRREITIKINRIDIASIVASFLRYDYTIKATFNDAKVFDSSKDRYDQLMNYLNM